MVNSLTWSVRTVRSVVTVAGNVRRKTGLNTSLFAKRCRQKERERSEEGNLKAEGVAGDHQVVRHLYSVRTLVCVARRQSTSARAAVSRDTAPINVRQRTGVSTSITVTSLAVVPGRQESLRVHPVNCEFLSQWCVGNVC